MKKVLAMLILLVLVLTLSGCSNNVAKESVKPANVTIENKNYGKTLAVDSKKTTYLSKMNSLQSQLDTELAYLDNGITADIIESTETRYKAWDNVLKEILDVLKKQLSESEVEELTKNQVKWVEYKENTAKSAAGPYDGGELAAIVYNNSLIRTTKDRCYELVNNYIK